jgi:putative aldouronate transport system permease protein
MAALTSAKLTDRVSYNKQKVLKKNLRLHWQLLVFMALPIIYLVIFKYVPMVGVQIAFRKFTISGGIWNSEWVGLDQFTKFFSSYQFARVLPNTLRISFYSLIAGFPFPIILALSLNAMQSTHYRKVIQTVTYIPHFISIVVLVGMIIAIFNPRSGMYGTLAKAITGVEPEDLLAKAEVFPHLYVWSGIWQNMGWSTIIYTAALSSVDIQLHEAAQIDGASRFKRVIHIDLPTILPTAIIMLILSSGSIMSVGFEKVYLMQNKLNLSTSEVISTYVYKVGLGQGSSDFSYSTAIGLFNSLVNMAMLVLVNWISRRLGESSLW